MTEPQELTGKVPAESVHRGIRRIPRALCERFAAIGDLAGTISDVLDEFGLYGAMGASVLRPTAPEARIVGTAITVHDVRAPRQPHLQTLTHVSLLGEIEAHNQAQPGDVLVIQGVPGVSSIGGLSASIGQRQGEIGAVVDGGIRDVAWQRSLGYPIWSRDVTPVTGKWRLQTVEINGPITVQGISVRAGDLVAADDTGVCFVPADMVQVVLERAEAIASGEGARHADIESGMSVRDLARKSYAYKQAAAAAPRP